MSLICFNENQTSKCDHEMPQTNPRHREEETQKTDRTLLTLSNPVYMYVIYNINQSCVFCCCFICFVVVVVLLLLLFVLILLILCHIRLEKSYHLFIGVKYSLTTALKSIRT